MAMIWPRGRGSDWRRCGTRALGGASLSAALLVAVAVCAFTAADNDRLTVAGLWPGPCSGRGRRRPGGPSGPGVRGYRARRAAGQAKALVRSRLRAAGGGGGRQDFPRAGPASPLVAFSASCAVARSTSRWGRQPR